MNFFEKYPEFINKGTTGVAGQRLEYRYKATIDNQRNSFKNSKVLDLASHDGRWSLASLKAGASKVVGIEGRENLVKKSNKILEKYGYGDKFTCFKEDLNNKILKFEEGSFDIILCLGFFYHTMHHFKLLSEFKRFKPKLIILDGVFNPTNFPGLVFGLEKVGRDGSSLETNKKKEEAIVGYPTILGAKMMLNHLDFKFKILNWMDFAENSWTGIDDYKKNKRLTFVIEPSN